MVQEEDENDDEEARGGAGIWIKRLISLYLPFPLVVDLCPAVVQIEDRKHTQRNELNTHFHSHHVCLFLQNMQETF